jgi:spore germination protein GerM
MRLAPAVLIPLAAACLVGGGCGADLTAATEPAVGRSQAPVRTTVYFLTDGGTVPLGVRRELVRRPGAMTARRALEELLAGPTEAERRFGLTTAIPAGGGIRSLTIEPHRSGSEAFVDLAGLPDAADAGAVSKVRVMTQVARTLIGLNDIARVWLRADGRPWGLWDLEGNIRDDPIDYERLRGFFHICAAKPGTEAVPGDCFTALP